MRYSKVLVTSVSVRACVCQIHTYRGAAHPACYCIEEEYKQHIVGLFKAPLTVYRQLYIEPIMFTLTQAVVASAQFNTSNIACTFYDTYDTPLLRGTLPSLLSCIITEVCVFSQFIYCILIIVHISLVYLRNVTALHPASYAFN